ncbi:MAG: YjfB family protein [Pelosinus sp.]|nr:YjfB family protein [Pelosinus sp.]
MDIPALSVVSSQLSTQQAVGICVLKKAMAAVDTSTTALLNIMVAPSDTIGTNIDTSV